MVLQACLTAINLSFTSMMVLGAIVCFTLAGTSILIPIIPLLMDKVVRLMRPRPSRSCPPTPFSVPLLRSSQRSTHLVSFFISLTHNRSLRHC